MSCTPKTIVSASYIAACENKSGGFNNNLQIVLEDDIGGYPEYGTGHPSMNVNQLRVNAKGSLVLKPGKFVYDIPALYNFVGANTKSVANNVFRTELTVRVQLNQNNEGFLVGLMGQRFLALVADQENNSRMIGHAAPNKTQFLARVKKDSVTFEHGTNVTDERYAEFVIEAEPHAPYYWNGTIVSAPPAFPVS